MTKEEIQEIVRAVLEEESKRRGAAIDEVVLKAVATILTSFGIEEDDRKELQADFIHLRKWRKSVEQAQGMTFKAIVGVIVTGALGALWLGQMIILAAFMTIAAAFLTWLIVRAKPGVLQGGALIFGIWLVAFAFQFAALAPERHCTTAAGICF